jgi:hypothetical protein
MSRTADYTIQGFLYQFNKTLLEILKSPDDSTIKIEGIVEDIEVHTTSDIEAIQCKYHETQDKFSLSTIYKPLLQMMQHFHLNNNKRIKYKLFCHFPLDPSIKIEITKADLEKTLKTENQQFKKYVEELSGKVNLDDFLKQFSIEIGSSLEDLTKEIHLLLEQLGIPSDDIEILAYPNAIQHIAELSIKHTPEERQTTRQKTIKLLKDIKRTAISKWTLALKSRNKILKEKRSQLKQNLDKNSRLRYLIVDPGEIENFEDDFILFIQDYQEKYHFKPAHIQTPTLCLLSSLDKTKEVQLRLEMKGIKCHDGIIAGIKFDESRFFKDPIIKRPKGAEMQREFDLRIICGDNAIQTLNNKKADDIFVIANSIPDGLDTRDVNIEILSTRSLQEIKYMMGISHAFE